MNREFSFTPVDKAADRDTIRDPKRGARSPDKRGLRRDWIYDCICGKRLQAFLLKGTRW